MVIKSNVAGLTNPKERLQLFDCGVSSVSDFLSQDALDSEQSGKCSTTVFYDSETGKVQGYYSLTASVASVRTSRDQAAFTELGLKFDEEISINEVSLPALEIAWLGVAKDYQGQGLGSSMVLDIFKSGQRARFELGIGIVVVQVAALRSAIEFYQKFGFQYLHSDPDKLGLVPETSPMFVSFKDIDEFIDRLSKK